MIGNYTIVSPSLEGVLSHETTSYDGLRRPIQLLRLLDSPKVSATRRAENKAKLAENRKILDEYFHDLYEIFMKKLTFFVVERESLPDETVRLQAMLQEMIKVKKLMEKLR